LYSDADTKLFVWVEAAHSPERFQSRARGIRRLLRLGSCYQFYSG
jgi:hypothetical protein